MLKRVVIITLLTAAFLAIAYEGYGVYAEYAVVEAKRQALGGEAEAVIAENERLQRNLDSLSDPAVVIKELKARFNYKLPNEKVIIVAPKEGEDR